MIITHAKRAKQVIGRDSTLFKMNTQIEKINHKQFRSAFSRPEQRRAFLFECAKDGLREICRVWPNDNIRLFVFGSAAKRPINIGANSDLDIAVAGLNHIAEKSWQRNSIILEIFRNGLLPDNQTLPIDLVTLDLDTQETPLTKEILNHGIEIKLD